MFSRRPILIFSSASTAYGAGLIAVILSGADSDDAAGARSVKAHSGIVVVQDPKTCGLGEMPEAVIASGVVIM